LKILLTILILGGLVLVGWLLTRDREIEIEFDPNDEEEEDE